MTDNIRTHAIRLLRDIADGNAATSVPESDRLRAMEYIMDAGWLSTTDEITPEGRAVLAEAEHV